jgi:hypothetical protein
MNLNLCHKSYTLAQQLLVKVLSYHKKNAPYIKISGTSIGGC